MLLMVETVIKGGICFYQYMKVSKKYIENYNKDKEFSYLKYQDVNNLYRQAISQKLHIKILRGLKLRKVEKLVAVLHNKQEYTLHIRNLK